MKITDFKIGEKIKIIDVDSIKQGSMMWDNDDIVEIKNVENDGEGYNRLDVWDMDKTLAEYIYPDEFSGIERLDMKKHLFHISLNFAAGVSFEDIIELPDTYTEEEIEEEFKEWVWDQLDTFRYEVK